MSSFPKQKFISKFEKASRNLDSSIRQWVSQTLSSLKESDFLRLSPDTEPALLVELPADLVYGSPPDSRKAVFNLPHMPEMQPSMNRLYAVSHNTSGT